MKRFIFAVCAIALTSVFCFALQPERGYRGFVDWTNRINHHTFAYKGDTNFCPGISTSHGYQFNSWLFAGVGIDYSLEDCSYDKYEEDGKFHNHLHYDPSNYYLSIFSDVRTDLIFGKFTPFADVRLGLNATSSGTVYFSPSIGYRFNWGRKVGINVGIGYTLDGYRYERYIIGTTPEGLTIGIPTGEHYNYNQSSFTFRIGIDF